MSDELNQIGTPATETTSALEAVSEWDGGAVETLSAAEKWEAPPIRTDKEPESAPVADEKSGEAPTVEATPVTTTVQEFSDDLLGFAEYAGIPRAIAGNFKDAAALRNTAQWIIDNRTAQPAGQNKQQPEADDIDLDKELGDDYDPKLRDLLKKMHGKTSGLQKEKEQLASQLREIQAVEERRAVAERQQAVTAVQNEFEQFYKSQDDLWKDSELLGSGPTSSLKQDSVAWKNRQAITEMAATMAVTLAQTGKPLPELSVLATQAKNAILADKAFQKRQEQASAKARRIASNSPALPTARNGSAPKPGDRMRSAMDEIYISAGLDPETGLPA